MHTLTLDIDGKGRCSCGLTFQGTPEEIKTKFMKHNRDWSPIGKCGFCGGPTPCTRED